MGLFTRNPNKIVNLIFSERVKRRFVGAIRYVFGQRLHGLKHPVCSKIRIEGGSLPYVHIAKRDEGFGRRLAIFACHLLLASMRGIAEYSLI